ncbi:MAG: P-II family nitrogen regulator [Halobacteriota archaeon]
MKKVEAVVRPDVLNEVKAALAEAGYPSMTVTEVKGRGNQEGVTQKWRGEEYKIDLLAKTKVEVVVPEEAVDDVVSAVVEGARTGDIGDGKVFVSPVDSAVRIRTGEEDGDAL